MTREEAILLSSYTGFLLVPDFSEVHKFCEDTLGRPIWTHEFADQDTQKEIQEKLRPRIMELIQNISALRPVSRERVEKVWRREWRWVGEDRWSDTYECSKCGKLSMNDYPFCPNCNSAMNDEAVEMVMERLNKLEETKK